MLTLVCFDNITEFITLDSVNGKCQRWKRVDPPPFSPLPRPVILNFTASGKTNGHIESCLLAADHNMVAWPSPSTDRYKLQTSFFSTEIPAALEPPPPPPPRLVPARTVVYRFFYFFHSRGTRDLGGGGGERSTAGRHRKKTAAAAAAPHARVSGSRRVQRAWVGGESVGSMGLSTCVPRLVNPIPRR